MGRYTQIVRELLDLSQIRNKEDVLELMSKGFMFRFKNCDQLPGYNNYINKHLLPELNQVKEGFLNSLISVKFEGIFTEPMFDLKNIFWRLAELNLWLADHARCKLYQNVSNAQFLLNYKCIRLINR